MAKVKNILNEDFLTGGNAMDAMLGPSTGVKNPAYTYKILPFNDDFQTKRQQNRGGTKYINVGSNVTAYTQGGKLISGRILKMTKDEDSYIVNVWVLDDKTGKIMTIKDIDSIKSIEHKNPQSRNASKYVNWMTPSKFLVSESVRRNGPIYFNSNKENCIATLNEGEVVILHVFDNKVAKITSLEESSEEMIKDALKIIND